MLSLTTLFEAEKNKKTGAKPVWILKIPFVSGTLYLSDRAVTITGWATPAIVTLPWIASWGSIDEDISSQLSMPMVSDFSVSIIIDPDAATDIHDLLWTEKVETIDCNLYLWFEGLNAVIDPPILKWVGNIIDFEKMNELVYQVSLVDQGVKLDNYPGRVLSLVDYPRAALDDVGYQMTILYGDVVKVPALRLDVAKRTALAENITDSDMAFDLVDGTGLIEDVSVIAIENEEILITGITGNTITTCARGYNNTGSFVDMSVGTGAWRAMTADLNGNVFACMNGNYVMKQTGGVGNFVAISNADNWLSLCAAPNGSIYAGTNAGSIWKQTGGVGAFNDLAQANLIWHGMAAGVTTNVYACAYGIDIYMQTAGAGNFVALSQGALNWTGMTVTPNGNVYACSCNSGVGGQIYMQTGGVGAFVSLAQVEANWYGIAATPNGDVFACRIGVGIYKQTAGVGDFVSLNQTIRLWYDMAAAPNGVVYSCVDAGNLYKWAGVTHTKDTLVVEAVDSVYLFADQSVKSIDTIYGQEMDSVVLANKILDITSLCDRYPGPPGAELAGYEGMAVVVCPYANYVTGERLLITGKGYQDGGAVLIERPDLIIEHFLYTYAGWATSNFEHADAATSLIADGYTFSVVIQERKTLREWLEYMALQCRCWFRFASGKAYLLYRPDTIVSDKTITGSMIAMNEDNTTTLTLRRSPLDEVINIVHLYYNRDWSRSAGREAYQAITRTENAASITAYGEKERADTFLFDFVTNAAMAVDLRDFYLARYKDRKKVVNLTAFLDNFELEFADGVTLASVGNILCEVRKVGITPGGTGVNDKVLLTAREY